MVEHLICSAPLLGPAIEELLERVATLERKGGCKIQNVQAGAFAFSIPRGAPTRR